MQRKILVKFNFVNATNTGSSGSYQTIRILRGSPQRSSLEVLGKPIQLIRTTDAHGI